MFDLNKELSRLEVILADSNDSIEKYLDTKDSDAFIVYLDRRTEIEAFIEQYDTGLSYDETELQLSNISQMLKEYLNEGERVIEFKRGRFTTEYIQAFENAKDLTLYIERKIQEVSLSEVAINLANYNNLTESIKQLTTSFLMVTILLILISIVFIYDYTDKVIHPIEKLSKYSKEISEGNYNEVTGEDLYFDEAMVLLDSFSDMARSIKLYIEEIQDKAITENKLRISEIKNLRMGNIVKEAELKALQSQINPHFLYNTLNAGVGLAEVEEAERTSDYLDHLAMLFRYNLKGLENVVTLRDEIRNIENYYQLMKVRFSDGIEFVFTLDEEMMDLEMPPLILQPLVENAFIHGFRDKASERKVEISVIREAKYARIEVLDNGRGISIEQLEMIKSRSILNTDQLIESHVMAVDTEHGHTTGLGVDNVKSRLELFYDSNEVFDIESKEGEWTKVTIRIPIEVTHV
jgi:sensor histidine kinase YesM